MEYQKNWNFLAYEMMNGYVTTRKNSRGSGVLVLLKAKSIQKSANR